MILAAARTLPKRIGYHVLLPGLSFDRALAVVEMHLRQRGEIQFQRLLQELKP